MKFTKFKIKKEKFCSIKRNFELYRIGEKIAGPILLHYINWVLGEAKKRGIKRVYFVARDGQVLYKIAKEFIDNKSIDIDVRYLYGSRQAWHLPSVFDISERELDWIFETDSIISVDIICKRIGLDTEYILREVRSNINSNIGLEDNISKYEISQMKKLIMKENIKEKILAAAKKNRELAVKYFEQQGLLSQHNISIIDLGWRGRLQDSIYKILSHANKDIKITGFYFGLFQYTCLTNDNNKKLTYFFNPKSGAKTLENVRKLPEFLEIFTAADHGKTIEYENADNKVKPVLSERYNKDAITWGLYFLRKGIITFVKEELSKANLNPNYAAWDNKDYIYKLINQVRYPKKIFAEIIGSFKFSSDQTDQTKRIFAPKFSFGDALKYIFSNRNNKIFMTFWVEGTAAQSSNIVRWILKIEIFIRRFKSLIKKMINWKKR